MSLVTTNEKNVQTYVDERIKANHNLILLAYSNGTDIIITPTDHGELADDFLAIGAFIWNDVINDVDFLAAKDV